MALPTVSIGQGSLGTRSGGGFSQISQATGFGIGNLIQMLVALGIVAILLKWLLPKVATKFLKSPKLSKTTTIQVLETTQVGPAQLHLIEAKGSLLLLSSNSTGLSLISVLHPTGDPITTEDEFKTKKKNSEYDEEPFSLCLDSEQSSPQIVVKSVNPLEALDRLARISS